MRINRIWLAAVAWEGYANKGRGIVWVMSTVPRVLEDARFRFVSKKEYSESPFRKGKSKVAEMASTYNPKTEFVVGFGAPKNGELHFYTIGTTPTPPDAVEAKLGKIWDALSRFPKVAKDVEAVESCLMKLMDKLGLETSSQEVLQIVLNKALFGMEGVCGPAQWLAPLREKMPVRDALVFHEPYNMEAEPGLWNLFNLYLRPLDEPQPDGVVKYEKNGAFVVAASVLWAAEQSRQLWQRTKPRAVLPDYLQAYEMVRMIARLARLDDNERAVEALASIAHLAAEELEKLPRGIVSYVASRHPSWPILVSARATARSKQSAAYLKELKVGVACPLNAAPESKWDEKLPTTRHAKNLFAILEYNRARRRIIQAGAELQQTNPELAPVFHAAIPQWAVDAMTLPPFSKASKERWWKLALVVLKEACPKLEEHPHFNVKGAVVAGIIADPIKRRGRITNRIKQAFDALASHDRTPTWRFEQRADPPSWRL